MVLYFDRFYENSYGASAMLLRERIKSENETDYFVFCTKGIYKDTFVKRKKDHHIITKYLFPFNNVFLLYVGFFLFTITNYNKIKRIVSFSSPGTNLFFHGLMFWANKLTYVVQDIFPENVLLVKNKKKFISVFRPLIKFCYNRISNLETISSDMSKYLYDEYSVTTKVVYNPNPYKSQNSKSIKKYHNKGSKFKIGYSGNLSYSHGYIGPKKLISTLLKINNLDINIRGFGKYFDKLKIEFNDKVKFGGSMNEIQYKEYLDSLDVLLLFQENEYQKVCLSCKFNTLIEMKKPIIYIGPDCDISKYINNCKIGVCIKIEESYDNIYTILNHFFNEFTSYNKNAIRNNNFDLNKYFNEINLLHE